MTWTACPSLEALFTADDSDEELQEHLATCRRCRALRHHLQPRDVETAVQPLEKDAAPAHDLSPERTLGSVYAIHGPLSDEYLLGALVDWDEEEAVVVPVSHETRFATNWDLLLEQQLLGYRARAQVWNHGTVLVEQLDEKIAELGDWAGALATLYEAVLESRELPTPVPVGPPVLSDVDPRLLFQEDEGERAAVYWQPATLLAGVENVFELVRLQRDALGLDADELDVEPTTLEALEGGTLDIGNQIPVPAFGTLLRRLKLGASRRLEQLVAAAVLANYTDRLEIETRPALARKRRGMRKRPESKSPERFAADYARKVMEVLRD
jgi:hypothetical protein